MKCIRHPEFFFAFARLCPSFGILPGFALDLTTHDTDCEHWDLDAEKMRARTWAKARSEQLLLLIETHMCTALSAWQHITNSMTDPETVAREYAQGLRQLSFWCELNAYQYETVIDGHTGMHKISVTKDGLISLCASQEREDRGEWNGHVLRFDDGEWPVFDDLNNQELPAPLVKAANRKELEY